MSESDVPVPPSAAIGRAGRHSSGAAATRRVRFGYHGSTAVADLIIRAAGRDTADVDLIQYDVADPFAELRAGRLDVMIGKFAVREPDLRCSTVLTSEPRVAAVSTAHPLARRETVSVEEIADYETFDRPGTLPGYIWDQVVPPVTPAGRGLRRVHPFLSPRQLMALVAEGRAVHMSVGSIGDVTPPGVIVIPVHDLAPAPVCLVWRAEGQLPDHVGRFVADAQAGAQAEAQAGAQAGAQADVRAGVQAGARCDAAAGSGTTPEAVR
ncbi:LysR substrate-binding domain-containing protein [Streptomyces sp. CB02923]|uniref:LysR substrate-binding domain-containing protein n=1 Tax=Streptomyces sp. CB02923 TaxID=1718985 RepID=UPI001F5B320D|nr:LysR substrate-binding domain-containing protein [Streptomyces sp. CB02923]